MLSQISTERRNFKEERSHQKYTLNVSIATKHDYMWQPWVEIERLCILIALPCSKCRNTELPLWVGLVQTYVTHEYLIRLHIAKAHQTQ